MTLGDSGVRWNPKEPSRVSAPGPYFLFPSCPGAFLAEGRFFSDNALSSLQGWQETDTVVLKMRAEFLSGRGRQLGLEDEAAWTWQECIGREDKERRTTDSGLGDKQEVEGWEREEQTGQGKGN